MQSNSKDQTVYDWNRKHLPGQKVKVTIDGKEVIARTRNNAELSGNSPVICLQGHVVPFSLNSVVAIK